MKTTTTTKPNINFADLLHEALTVPGTISRAYSLFHNYSLGNQTAVMIQCAIREITPGPINTYKGWKKLGRNVKKGEKAIALCMPVVVKNKKAAEQETDTDSCFTIFLWKNNWFVLAQTEGEEFKQEITPINFDLNNVLATYSIVKETFTEVDGNTQGVANIFSEISINPLAVNPFKTSIHEIAHILLGHLKKEETKDVSSATKAIYEVEAEAVSYIVLSVLEENGLEESRGYIQHWLQGNTLPESSAKKIFKVADQIIKAGTSVKKTEEKIAA